MCEEREIDYSGCNKKQLIAMLEETQKERDAHIVEEENDDELQDGHDSQEEDGNAARDEQIETDSDVIATLKLQL